jgi:CheY-like chemotaxis protein
LVVDDDEATRELLRELLGRAGAQVVTGSSAGDALEAVKRRRPHLIIADIGMPQEDGLTLMRRIRALDGNDGHIPSIALSAYTRGEDQQAARDAGFSLFMAKPASPQDILIAAQSLLVNDSANV